MRVLVTGGLGFIGSHVAEQLIELGHEVIVLDGVLAETGGAEKLWDGAGAQQVYSTRIEEASNLVSLVKSSDAIVDAMGWTRHLSAIKNPLYDMELNVASHLPLVKALHECDGKIVIYLGSRGQYGNPKVKKITEDTPQSPEDIQGIHKVAAEYYYKELSKRTSHKVCSIRFGNSYGERQPMKGDDIGLFGGFVRGLMDDDCIELFGRGRTRPFVYAKDVARACASILEKNKLGFTAYNFGSSGVDLELLLGKLIESIGTGSYTVVEPPEEIKAVDMGNAEFTMDRFYKDFSDFKMTPFEEGIENTVNSIKERKL